MSKNHATSLTPQQGFWYYLPAGFVGAIAVSILTFASPLLGLLFLIPAIALFYILKSNLKFKVIPTNPTFTKFREVASDVANERGWEIIELSDHKFIAKSGFTWRSWGELITVYLEEDHVLFNSICDPDAQMSVTSWGRNGQNFRAFKRTVERFVEWK